jgi:hypothetical protein
MQRQKKGRLRGGKAANGLPDEAVESSLRLTAETMTWRGQFLPGTDDTSETWFLSRPFFWTLRRY